MIYIFYSFLERCGEIAVFCNAKQQMKQIPTLKKRPLSRQPVGLLLYNIYTNKHWIQKPSVLSVMKIFVLLASIGYSMQSKNCKPMLQTIYSFAVRKDFFTANPSKAQVCFFHLKNTETNRP